MSSKTAIFAGTFDPVTNGHLDLVRRALRVSDRVVVSVARGGKGALFTPEQRLALLETALADIPGVQVEVFEGLVIEQAKRHGAGVLLRGIRSFQDWDYEMQMAFANRGLADGIETIFLPPSPGMTNVSASLVREVSALGGDVSAWVPPHVVQALTERFRSKPAN
jgi:pantetheine-phosphate adenylyltransferase